MLAVENNFLGRGKQNMGCLADLSRAMNNLNVPKPGNDQLFIPKQQIPDD